MVIVKQIIVNCKLLYHKSACENHSATAALADAVGARTWLVTVRRPLRLIMRGRWPWRRCRSTRWKSSRRWVVGRFVGLGWVVRIAQQANIDHVENKHDGMNLFMPSYLAEYCLYLWLMYAACSWWSLSSPDGQFVRLYAHTA